MKLQLADLYDIEIERADDLSNPVIIDGFVSQPSTTISNARAGVQPAPAKDIEQLPEGDTLHDVKKIWSHTELKVRDIITWQGKKYSVLKLMAWPIPTFKIGHYSALMTGEARSNAS